MGTLKGSEQEGFISLTMEVEKEGDQYVSICQELGTASCGDTMEEAFSNLEEAIVVHLNAMEHVGECKRVLAEKGIPVQRRLAGEPRVDAILERRIPLGAVIKALEQPIKVFA